MSTTTHDTQDATLHVRAPGGDYDVLVGYRLLDRLGALVGHLGLGRRVAVATDDTVLPLHAERVAEVLRAAGYEPHLLAMPAGEQHKSWESVSFFLDGFVRAGLDRSGWVMAVGGGVVGDTAGFAASIYMRGVRLVQAPTTLLAMSDASVGGKVGVDHPAGKNLLGAFKQPDLVVADLDALRTLSSLQVACGMAEIIKAGIISDPDLFHLIERSDASTLDYKEAVLRAIAVKRDIVEADPYENGVRALLNLGHTFGHAFESCTLYSRPHGVAVAQGMTVAFDLASALGLCPSAEGERVRAVLSAWGLPVRWGAPGLESSDAPERVYAAMLYDKKRRDGRLRLVLPQAIGKVIVYEDAPRELILERLVALQ